MDLGSSSLGILETFACTPALVALDAMEKAGAIRVVQAELNDFLGVVLKIAGSHADVQAALAAGVAAAERMGGKPVAAQLPQVDPEAARAIHSAAEFNPLIQQAVVWGPGEAPEWQPVSKGEPVASGEIQALGFIETQGFTAVFEAIDTACKAGNVEVVGKEKLGGGFVTVVIRGDVAAVKAAIEAGRTRVEGLGKLIAAHVIARPSASVLALLPKM